MSTPLPGSSEAYVDDKRLRRRVSNAAYRGRQLPTPAEAGLAVEIAREGLAQRAKVVRYALISAMLFLLSASLHARSGDIVLMSVYLAVVVLQLLVIPLHNRVLCPRLERAIDLNVPVAARDD